MPKLTPSEATEKWIRNLKASTPDIKRGVERVTEAPSAKAVAQQEKMILKLIESIEDGTWAKNLLAYDLPEWKKDMIEKGIKRISQGADSAEGKVKQFMSWLMPRLEEGQRIIENMPNVTLDDSIARMEAHTRHMAEKKYKKEK